MNIVEASKKYLYEEDDTSNQLQINYSDLDIETRSKILELIATASKNRFNPNDNTTKIQIEDKLSKHPLFTLNGEDVLQLINI